jgi:hypothetical protein
MRRLTIAFAGVLLWSLVGASAALAAPPSNDDIGSPTEIGSVPFGDGPYDTTEATNGATDPGFCFSPDAGPDRATVWYSFTPVESGAYLADTFGSSYDTTLYVGTPDGAGGLDVLGCIDDSSGSLQSAVSWEGTAGITYLIMVGTCCGPVEWQPGGGGGSLIFHLGVAPPPPTMALSVEPTGGFTSDGGAVITGSLDCSPGLAFSIVNIEVVQRSGRFNVAGFGGSFFSGCPSEWALLARSNSGTFRGGSVEVNATAFGCAEVSCADDVVSRSVRLTGERPFVAPPGPPPVKPPPANPPPVSPPVPQPHQPPVSPPVHQPPVSPPAHQPPVCPPSGGHVTPPMGRPECPGPVSPPVSGPVSGLVAAPEGGLASAIAGALRADPVVLIGGVFAGVLTLASAAGAVAAVPGWRRRLVV